MSEQSREPGWYQDPFGTGPEDRRYWDGETWLAVQQTQPVAFEAPGAPAQPAPPMPQQPQTGQPFDQQGKTYDPPPAAPLGWGQPASPEDRIRTPDGVELASWGRRLAAYVVDAIVLGVAFAVLGGVLGLWSAFTDLAESIDPTATDLTPQVEAFVAQHSGALLAFSLLQILISGAYHVVLVATRGRTIGKRMLGIRVRLREREGLPMWRAALSRWLVHYGLPTLLSGVPGLAFLGAAFPIVDGLWPLWDPRRQAIHDKLAKTAVVRG
ncbi:RDD family protein [Agrococcus sp. SGAir0287]|uniref:RDD family protein n=1 Tax=Agrococcus sp. SGAir0287 TaxID=2070347 RepID=UPI0010CCBD2A|nr:RDD family protein [Agrococcus sp. SGAir0287]QCR18199.1 hypothetical protein C1N71_01015 [Agrococcus sp. SGAir0287]